MLGSRHSSLNKNRVAKMVTKLILFGFWVFTLPEIPSH